MTQTGPSMTEQNSDISSDNPDRLEPKEQPVYWGGVFSVTFGVFGLVAAEFMPVSLLTPIANSLSITEGQSGQAMSATSICAFITCLIIAPLANKIDRRHLLMGLTALLVASNVIVALSFNFSVLLLGRMLVGFALGGFWTMSTAIIMRLVPSDRVPKAFSIMYTGVSAATVLSAPIGSYLGNIVGWRYVFIISAVFALAVFVSQFMTLPKLPPRRRATFKTLLRVLSLPGIKLAVASLSLSVFGHFAVFTYIRPFLETATKVDANGVSLILLVFGLANFGGTYISGWLVTRNLRLTVASATIVIGLCGLGMYVTNGALYPTVLAMAVWGFILGLIPVSWATWVTKALPDDAESGGSLVVAGFQIAITSGAVIGGIILDHGGPASVVGFGGAFGLFGGVFAFLALAKSLSRKIA